MKNMVFLDKKEDNKFSTFIKQKGIEFEEKIFNHIRSKYYTKTLDFYNQKVFIY